MLRGGLGGVSRGVPRGRVGFMRVSARVRRRGQGRLLFLGCTREPWVSKLLKD